MPTGVVAQQLRDHPRQQRANCGYSQPLFV